MTSYSLIPWPDAALPAIESLTAEVTLGRDRLRLRYELKGRLDALHLPPLAAAPAAQDGLWRHSCFEAFLGDAAGTRYLEFNFSPSGDWAQYAFSAPRIREHRGPAAAAAPTCIHGENTLTLVAGLQRSALGWPITTETPLGLSAVLETRAGHLTYWALCHPGAKPDFHDRRGWTARMTNQDPTA